MSDPRQSSAAEAAAPGEPGPSVGGSRAPDFPARLIPDDLADLAAAEQARSAVPRTAASAADAGPDHPGPQFGSEPLRPAHPAPGDGHPGVGDGSGEESDPVAKERPPTVWEQMGGPMGMIDSGLPVVVFIVANVIGGLGWGIGAALTAAVVIAIARIIRKRPVTQAIAGVFGVGIAAYIAYRTDSAKGYFLLGIWSYLLYGGALLVSMLVRWPLIGVIWEAINGRGTAWRNDRKLVRRYDYATFVWVVVFASRYLVQNYLYDSDQVGWLAAVRLLMGYPVFLLAIAISVWIVAGGSAVKVPDSWKRRRTN